MLRYLSVTELVPGCKGLISMPFTLFQVIYAILLLQVMVGTIHRTSSRCSQTSSLSIRLIHRIVRDAGTFLKGNIRNTHSVITARYVPVACDPNVLLNVLYNSFPPQKMTSSAKTGIMFLARYLLPLEVEVCINSEE